MRRDLAFHVAAHLLRRRIERISASRLSVDRAALTRLSERVSERMEKRPEICDVVREDLTSLLDELATQGLSPGTINHHVASLRCFFAALEKRGLLLENPAASLRHLRHDPLPRDVPTKEEMRRLLSVADTRTREGRRDRALFELLYGSGLRKAELLSLDLRDVDLKERTVFVRSGKGGKDRVVPMTEEAARWLAAHLAERPCSRSQRLFLTPRDHTPLSTPFLNARLHALAERAGIERRLTVHALRHACALHLLEGGADVVSIKQLLGHARLDTTAVYLRLSTGHLARSLRRSHPRG